MKNINIIAIFILLIFSSCDILTTRDPEDPEQQRSNFMSATRPEEVILNLQNSFTEGIVENYLASFSDTKFNFIPSAGSELIYPSLQDWDLKSEEQYFKSLILLIPESAQITLNFTQSEYQKYNDSTVYIADYSLNIPFFDESRVRFYSGKLQFTILRDSSLQWSISNWRDIKVESNVSWSELKGGLY